MKGRMVLAACLALVLVFLVRWQFPDDRSSRISPALPDTRFDYTLTDFSARFRRTDGELELLIQGPRLEHTAETRIATVTTPEFHIEPDGANWRGRADRGLIVRDAEELILQGNVVLTQPGPDGERRIVTESLHHRASARTIVADSPAEFSQPGAFVRAGSLIIRLDDDIVEFSQHVQGELHPGRSASGHERRRSEP